MYVFSIVKSYDTNNTNCIIHTENAIKRNKTKWASIQSRKPTRKLSQEEKLRP